MRILPVLLLVPCLLAATPAACEEPADAAVKQAVQKYVAAFNAGDAEGAAALYTPDGSHTYVTGVTHHGRTEIANGLRQMLAGPFKGGKLAIETLRLRLSRPASPSKRRRSPWRG